MNVDILIGSEYYWKLVTGEVIRGYVGPTVVHTKLGWVLSGPVQGLQQGNSRVNLISTHSLRVGGEIMQNDKQDLDERLKMFWNLDALGIIEDECLSLIHI